MAFRHDIAGGNGDLIARSLQSPDFETGVRGWQVRRDGSVEFNNGTFRGTISGGTLIISQGSGATFEQIEINGATGVTTWSKYKSPTVVIRQILANGTDLTYADPGSGGSQGALITSSSPVAGTDGFGNVYLSGVATYNGGLTVQLDTGTAVFYPFGGGASAPGEIFAGSTGQLVMQSPAQVSTDSQSQAVLRSEDQIGSSTPSASLKILDAVDGADYNTQILTKFLTADTGTLTSLTTVFSSPVGARHYRIHGQLFISAASGAQFQMNVALPAGAGGKVSFVICRATTFVGQVTGGPNGGFGAAVSLATTTYSVVVDGLVTVTGNGTMNFQVGSLTSTGLVVQTSSSIDIIPV